MYVEMGMMYEMRIFVIHLCGNGCAKCEVGIVIIWYVVMV